MPTLDELQGQTVTRLVEAASGARAERGSLWNLSGAFGSGKTTILRQMHQQFQSGGKLIPILISPPYWQMDTGPAALSDITDQLSAGNLLNGESRILDDPKVGWREKLANVICVLEKRAEELVLLCDEPSQWRESRRNHDVDESESFGHALGSWVFHSPCRRVIAGWLTTGQPLAREIVPRPPDPRELLLHARWGSLETQANAVAAALDTTRPSPTPLEIRVQIALGFLGVRGLTQPTMNLLIPIIEQESGRNRIKEALVSLALSRDAISKDAFRSLTRQLSPAESDLLRFCFCVSVNERIELHPAFRTAALKWKMPRDLLAMSHSQLRDEWESRPHGLRRDLEMLHHELLGCRASLNPQDPRLRFPQQLQQMGRVLSLVYQDYAGAAKSFEAAIALDAQSSYSHHYLAYNLDWEARDSQRVEKHYRQAIALRPTHPWHWSRWICYLVTRGRFREAREQWAEAIGNLSVSEESPDWLFRALHKWVARWMLHWGELDFAEAVLSSIPTALKAEGAFQSLENLSAALRAAEVNPAVFPLSVPVKEWWNQAGHTGLPLRIGHDLLTAWKPARVDAIEAESIILFAADQPDGGESVYSDIELTREDVARNAMSFDWTDLAEGRFVELGFYGEPAVLKCIGLHRDVQFWDQNLPPLRPPADRWYQRAVEEAWRDLGGAEHR